MRQETESRRGKVVWWVCGGLLLVFAALVGYQLFIRRARFVADEELLKSLAESRIEEGDGPPRDPKTWAQWRGARRDGVTTAPDLLDDWPEGGPKELWRVMGGDGYSSFAVAGGRAYSMLGAGGKQEVVAWDVTDGTRLWGREYGGSAGSDHGGYGGPRATPTIDGDRLYTLTSWGVLLCLEATTGGEKWKRDLPQELGGRTPRWGYAGSPLVEGDLVYAMPGGDGGRCLAAFDKLTGKLVWSSQDDVAGYSSPIAVTIGGVRQVVFLTGNRLVGVTADKGQLLWNFPWQDRFNVNAATPVFFRAGDGDYLFITSGYSRGCALVNVKSSGGKFESKPVYESNELCCHFSSPVLHGDHLYALDETRDLTCLDVRTGQVKWRKPRAFQKGSLLRVDDRLIVLGEQGHLAMIACDPEQYREIGKRCRPFKGRCWTMPVLADGRLYLRDQSEVVCLEVRR